MTTPVFRFLLPVVAMTMAACETAGSPEEGASLGVDEKTALVAEAPVSPGGPVRIGHEVVGTPVVGQPLLIDLRFESRGDAVPMRVDYRINDSTALQFRQPPLQP